MRRQFASKFLFLLTALAALCAPAHAVILHAKSDRNTRPPHASLVNSGWQWQGQFGGFLGTPIARNYFITSGHIGGSLGQSFEFQGTNYTTTAYFDDPATDLRIWKVDGQFPTWAPLFKHDTEVGRSCVIFGRGTQRGDEIIVNGQLKGWQWGPQDGVQSWGRNSIVGVVDGGPERGDMLYFNFDRVGNSHEGFLSAGDSGGGLFVRQGTVWKLAGINTSVDGPYSYLPGDTTFNAAIFDKGGLAVPGINNGNPIPDGFMDVPAAAYATRISTNLDWINGVLSGKVQPGGAADTKGGIPEPTGALITLIGLGALVLRRRRRTEAD